MNFAVNSSHLHTLRDVELGEEVMAFLRESLVQVTLARAKNF
jgi:hypothetical protein